MAERERLTNKERRALAREERRRKEAEAAARKQRGNWRNGLVTFAIVGVIAAVVLQAFLGGDETIDDAILIADAEAEAAFDEAGCEVLADREPLPERYHFEANQQPNPDTIYTDVRPTHSGPHTTGVHPVTAASSSQISETASTHNLEHGTIIAWWDPEQLDGSTASDLGDWASTLNASGFRNDRGGVGIMTAPFEDPGISSGKPVALRAWGTAWDCDEWNETVANSFVIENFGTRGIGPERVLGQYPDGLLEFEDREVEDTTEEQAPADEPTDTEELEGEELEDLDDAEDGAAEEAGDEQPDDEAPAED